MHQSIMLSSSYEIVRVTLILLVLLKSDISAFLGKPVWSTYSYVTCANRRPLICSVKSGPVQLENSLQTQAIAIQRKYDKKNNYNSKVYSFQRASGTTSTSLWESKLRNAITTKKYDEAFSLLRDLNSTKLPSGRDVVYVITETSRRSNNISAIIPLLSSMTKMANEFDYTTENDVMPLLFDCSTTNSISFGYRIVSWLLKRNVQFSAKTYSVLLKGKSKVFHFFTSILSLLLLTLDVRIADIMLLLLIEYNILR